MEVQVTHLRAMVEGLEKRLQEELRAFLAVAEKRLQAREEQMRGIGEGMQATADALHEQLSRRVDARLKDLDRASFHRDERGSDEVSESLRRQQADLRALESRLQKLGGLEDLPDRVREMERAFQLRLEEKLTAQERRAAELRNQLEANSEAWRDSLIQRCQALETKVWEKTGERSEVTETVMRRLTDSSQFREMQEEVRSQSYTGEVLQRRLTTCEAKLSKLSGLEAKMELLESQTVQHFEDQATVTREIQDLSQRVSLKVASAEGAAQRAEAQAASVESRLKAQLEEDRLRRTGDLEGLQQRLLQRINEVESQAQRSLARGDRDLQASAAPVQTPDDLNALQRQLEARIRDVEARGEALAEASRHGWMTALSELRKDLREGLEPLDRRLSQHDRTISELQRAQLPSTLARALEKEKPGDEVRGGADVRISALEADFESRLASVEQIFRLGAETQKARLESVEARLGEVQVNAARAQAGVEGLKESVLSLETLRSSALSTDSLHLEELRAKSLEVAAEAEVTRNRHEALESRVASLGAEVQRLAPNLGVLRESLRDLDTRHEVARATLFSMEVVVQSLQEGLSGVRSSPPHGSPPAPGSDVQQCPASSEARALELSGRQLAELRTEVTELRSRVAAMGVTATTISEDQSLRLQEGSALLRQDLGDLQHDVARQLQELQTRTAAIERRLAGPASLTAHAADLPSLTLLESRLGHLEEQLVSLDSLGVSRETDQTPGAPGPHFGLFARVQNLERSSELVTEDLGQVERRVLHLERLVMELPPSGLGFGLEMSGLEDSNWSHPGSAARKAEPQGRWAQEEGADSSREFDFDATLEETSPPAAQGKEQKGKGMARQRLQREEEREEERRRNEKKDEEHRKAEDRAGEERKVAEERERRLQEEQRARQEEEHRKQQAEHQRLQEEAAARAVAASARNREEEEMRRLAEEARQRSAQEAQKRREETAVGRWIELAAALLDQSEAEVAELLMAEHEELKRTKLKTRYGWLQLLMGSLQKVDKEARAELEKAAAAKKARASPTQAHDTPGRPRKDRLDKLPLVARASKKSKEEEIRKAYDAIDERKADGLSFQDLQSYLCDHLGFGLWEVTAFHQRLSAPPKNLVSFEKFKEGYGDLNPFMLLQRKESIIVRKPGAFLGQQLNLDSLEDCEVFACDTTAQVFVDFCKRCVVLLAPCESSAFIRDCEDCVFWLAVQQLRTNNCKRCTFYLYSKTEPIIETSEDLAFAPWAAHYPGSVRQFQQKGFRTERNLWNNVFDFTGKAGRANWRILPFHEITELVVELDEIPKLSSEPESPGPPITHALLCAEPQSSGQSCGEGVANIPQTRPPLPAAPPPGSSLRRWVFRDAPADRTIGFTHYEALSKSGSVPPKLADASDAIAVAKAVAVPKAEVAVPKAAGIGIAGGVQKTQVQGTMLADEEESDDEPVQKAVPKLTPIPKQVAPAAAAAKSKAAPSRAEMRAMLGEDSSDEGAQSQPSEPSIPSIPSSPASAFPWQSKAAPPPPRATAFQPPAAQVVEEVDTEDEYDEDEIEQAVASMAAPKPVAKSTVSKAQPKASSGASPSPSPGRSSGDSYDDDHFDDEDEMPLP